MKAWAVLLAIAVAGRAHADEIGLRAESHAEPRLRSSVRVELAACLDAERDAIRHAIAVELNGEVEAGVEVRVACAAEGLDAGVVLEVHRPGGDRRYRYALDWRTQPADARPRLVGLAVAEAVEASRIELTAVPEPPVRVLVERPVVAAPPEASWQLSVVGDRRSFAAEPRVRLIGAGLMMQRPLSPHLRVAADLVVESQTLLAFPGSVAVLSVSSAPRVLVRAGGRLHGEVGAGVRVGMVEMRGETLTHSGLVGNDLLRPWFGPAATASIGFDLTPQLAIEASAEIGITAAGVTARDLATTAAALDGRWTSLGIAAAFTL